MQSTETVIQAMIDRETAAWDARDADETVRRAREFLQPVLEALGRGSR